MERLIIKLGADTTELTRGLVDANKRLEEFGKKTEAQLAPNGPTGRAIRGFGVNARGMMMMARGGMHLFNAKNAQQQLQGLNQIVMAVGRQFGVFGIMGAAAFSMIMSKTDEAKKAANKAFASMVSGAKSFATTLAETDFSVFKKGLDNAMEELNPTTTFGDVKKFAIGLAAEKYGVSDETVKKLIINKVGNEVENSRKLMEDLMKDPAMKELMRKGQVYKAEADISKSRDELDLKRETVGMQGEAVKLYKIEKQLRESMAGPEKFKEVDELRGKAGDLLIAQMKDQLDNKRRLLGVEKEDVEFVKKRQELEKLGGPLLAERLKKLSELQYKAGWDTVMKHSDESFKKRATAGMTPGEKEAWRLSRLEFPPPKDIIDRTAALIDLDAAITKLGSSSLSMEQKNLAFGLTGPEAERQDLLRRGGKESDPLFQRSVSAERVGQMNELSKAVEGYSLSLSGATKWEKAFAEAAEGGLSKSLAAAKSLLQESTQTTERYLLPVDKYLQRQAELDSMLRAGTITWNTYNRALADAQKPLNAVANAEAQVAFGSAAAQRELYKFAQANRPVNAQRLELAGSEAGANKQLAETVKGNGFLEIIVKALKKQEDVPPVELAPALL